MWYAFFQKERQPLTIHGHDWGVTGIGLDANDASKVCLSAGMYTNSWDANNGSILRSSDSGTTWSETKLPFKLPGNQRGRGVGERLVVDPANRNIIYFAAPSGNGLYKSTDQGVTSSKVAGVSALGNYAEDTSDTSAYNSDLTGLTSLVFATASGTINGATSRIFVGTAYVNSSSVYVSNECRDHMVCCSMSTGWIFPEEDEVLCRGEGIVYLVQQCGRPLRCRKWKRVSICNQRDLEGHYSSMAGREQSYLWLWWSCSRC